MKILATNVFVGPNIYARFPVIRHVLDLGALEEWPTGRLGPAFNDALLAHLPGLYQHGCSYGTPGGFVRRLKEDEGTWFGHVMEHVALELQSVAGSNVTFGKTRATDNPGEYNMIFQYKDEEVGREASRLALDVLHHLLPAKLKPADAPDKDWNFEEERDRFIRYAQRRALGPSTASLVRAAEDRSIPWIRLNRYSLLQFGHGKYQKRIQATTTSDTSNIAVELASDKEETNRILSDLGLPVPRQRLVYSERETVRAAERIGYPVVVKPIAANHGRGVSTNLRSAEEAEAAFAKAREHARTVIVESFIAGYDHRILIINGEMVAAAKRIPGHVLSDGQHSISDLVDKVNQDPRRGVGHEKVLTRLEFDHQAEKVLALHGYTKDSVPEAGEVVYLRRTANLSTGGTAIDVTDIIHPDNRDMAIRSVRGLGLDIGGVDFLTTDISESYRDTGGAICEVNAGPGFRMHVAPSEGEPRDVAGPVVDMLYPPGCPSTIPMACITGTNGKTTTSRMLAHIMKLAGYTVGLASTDGVYIDGALSVDGDMTGPMATQMILRDPTVDAAVLETARGGLLRRGMGISQCDVAACLNVSADHLGLRGIDTLEQLAEVKRIPIEIARNTVVLNADDVNCLKMADYAEAEHVCYITMNPAHELVKQHIQSGGRAVVLEEGYAGYMITIYDSGNHIPLLWTHLIPATLEGRALHNVQNAMFAAALAHSLGVTLENIRHGLRTFDTTFFQAPGRMNVFTEHPFKVILDYAHNPAAVKTMCDVVDRLDEPGRKLLVLSAPGDRRDEDIQEIGRIAAGHFDYFVCRSDDNPRGRQPDEVPRMLAAALEKAGVDEASITVIPDEQDAIDAALAMASAGDLVLIFGDNVKRCWKQIIYFDAKAQKQKPQEIKKTRMVPAEEPGFAMDADVTLISDERGVRIAREPEAED